MSLTTDRSMARTPADLHASAKAICKTLDHEFRLGLADPLDQVDALQTIEEHVAEMIDARRAPDVPAPSAENGEATDA